MSSLAPTCPVCGAPDPAQGHLDRDRAAALKAAASDRSFKIGCWSVVALVIGLPLAVGLISWIGGSGEQQEKAGDRGSAEYFCEQFVKDRLKSPATAKFSDETTTGGGNSWSTRGNVDSQNGFGATIRSSFACSIRYDPADDSWTLVSLTGLR